MANSHQVKSAWESGELVFRNLAGTELLRLGAAGVSISGLLYPTADGTANQVIETDGSGTLTFGDDAGQA